MSLRPAGLMDIVVSSHKKMLVFTYDDGFHDCFFIWYYSDLPCIANSVNITVS